jgi:hypothetical protein
MINERVLGFGPYIFEIWWYLQAAVAGAGVYGYIASEFLDGKICYLTAITMVMTLFGTRKR